MRAGEAPMCLLSLREQKELDKLILDKIQSIEGVGRTETHIAID
jgi:hypothetical protein